MGMVAAGEVGKARRRWRDCYFLRWAMFWGSEVRRRGVFSKLFLISNLTAENTLDHSILTEHLNLHVCRLFTWRNQLGYPAHTGLTWRNPLGYPAHTGLISLSVHLFVCLSVRYL